MPKAHRDGDLRTCGATTVVTGQSTVYVNNKLWAVEGDLNDHGQGALRAVLSQDIFIENKKAIVTPGDEAFPDDQHPEPDTWPSQGSDDVLPYQQKSQEAQRERKEKTSFQENI